MPVDPKQTISAQVIVRAASGAAPDASAAVTTKTIHEFAPSPVEAERVMSFFRTAGFDVGPLIGNNFSITARAEQFEDVFRAELRRRGYGSVAAQREGGGADLELPLDSLPTTIRGLVAAATFPRPPDFGPSNF